MTYHTCQLSDYKLIPLKNQVGKSGCSLNLVSEGNSAMKNVGGVPESARARYHIRYTAEVAGDLRGAHALS